ncbi:uncharacterized protein LOC132934470 [Metopolophium dirhodum]|uniref:uncharacterized protein LOC132934470 n=1 Tax=Metopolophium dirhodum TaxID=44670 RepID=UPI00298F89EE|nr:uncharacterized protein LOC132934470 [Metopolophium dirhodum]
MADEFSNNSAISFDPLKITRKKKVPRLAGEMVCDEQISDPLKKFEVETFNSVIDITLSQLKNRFDSTNIGPLKDMSLLSRRRIREIKRNPNALPQDSFEKLCSMYTMMDRDILITEYKLFCNNFTEIESSVLLPRALNGSFISCEDQNDEEYDIDVNPNIDMDDDNDDDRDRTEQIKTNMTSTLQIFKIFCTANLATVFPNLFYVIKLSVTLPVTSCSVERSFSKLKLIKTKLRTSMIQDRLEHLIKISCERDIQPNNENIIISMAGKSSVLNKGLMY